MAVAPLEVATEVLSRDFVVMAGLTLLLFVLGWGWRGRLGRINRVEGAVLVSIYLGYTLLLLRSIGVF